MDHGAVDLILDRREMRDRLAGLLAMMTRQPAPAADVEN
jgi:acetyl-CoA carboxylase carboxyl transferase subunit beta